MDFPTLKMNPNLEHDLKEKSLKRKYHWILGFCFCLTYTFCLILIIVFIGGLKGLLLILALFIVFLIGANAGVKLWKIDNL